MNPSAHNIPAAKSSIKQRFRCRPKGQQGNIGRNVLRGFGATQADVAVQRPFHLTESMNLRFRSEFFNIFNHPNFGNPVNSLTSPLFGHSTQKLASSFGSGGANGGFNPLTKSAAPAQFSSPSTLLLSNECSALWHNMSDQLQFFARQNARP